MNDKKIEFLYQSISDAQQTIRAIDVKVGFLFVVNFLPISGISVIANDLTKIWSVHWISVLSVMTLFFWVLSVVFLFLCLKPVINLGQYINGEVLSGCFYTGGVPPVGVRNIFSMKGIKSTVTIKQYLELIPQNDEELLSELTFEKMKVSIIRNVKTLRINWCAYMTILWLISSMIISLYFYM